MAFEWRRGWSPAAVMNDATGRDSSFGARAIARRKEIFKG
jgi:hypothetical protein